MIKVRFAPSPTGYLHIGGARTALFNWMYARAQGGTFVLRIEDTDQQRSKKEYEEEILRSLKWLGFEWDELYYQSQRFDIYREHAQRLLDEGKAYKEGEAIILKMIPDQEIKIFDLIRGEITFDSSELKDQVLMKSDGSPAYSFCCVVDDALMEISHVVRGEDHISNTPKQIMIYRALDWKVPKYAHLPLIMGEDGSRLSKRYGAVAVSDYQKQGYVAEALVNYLMLLGWSPGNNQEKISPEAAIKKFSLKKINKAGAVFSLEKLQWLNNLYLKELETPQLVEMLRPVLAEHGLDASELSGQEMANIVQLYKGRLTTLNIFAEWVDYAFLRDIEISGEMKHKHITPEAVEVLHEMARKVEAAGDFSALEAEKIFKGIAEDRGFKASQLVLPARVALTAKDVGPSLFEIMAILGKERTAKRLSTISA
ncbi:MAG: glutamate--tRNA ligase [Candidatus Omnitrophica bacterium]|nr:glutamate--tRNA ligase [Candidatus Omnitrophota bacterium]